MLLIAAVLAPSVAKSAVSPKTGTRPAQFADLRYLAVLGDFDSDRRLDHAEFHLEGSHHCIRVRFGNFRETHLDFGMRPHSSGALLLWDVNHDSKPDLIWVYQSRLESAVVWLNEGAGRFAKARVGSGEANANVLFGDTGYAGTGNVDNEPIYLTPAQPQPDLARAGCLENEALTTVVIGGSDRRRDLGLYLSYLRERGPPRPF